MGVSEENKNFLGDPEKLILVDESDRAIGTGEKRAVHFQGALHRSFSVIILNSKGEALLQRRAKRKYHSGGMWSNTCCGHPHPGESVLEAAHRRLGEEMGIDCELKEIFTFQYRSALNNSMTENEYDHVLLGWWDGLSPQPHPDEVSDWKWVRLEDLRADMTANPDHYTYWFRILIEEMKQRASL
jgi:isopentenyl-diphosphate delta-isomerase